DAAFGQQDAVSRAGGFHLLGQFAHMVVAEVVGEAVLAGQQPALAAVGHDQAASAPIAAGIIAVAATVAQAALLHGLAHQGGELAPAQPGKRMQAGHGGVATTAHEPDIGQAHGNREQGKSAPQHPCRHISPLLLHGFCRMVHTPGLLVAYGHEKARQSGSREGRGANGEGTGGPVSILPKRFVLCNNAVLTPTECCVSRYSHPDAYGYCPPSAPEAPPAPAARRCAAGARGSARRCVRRAHRSPRAWARPSAATPAARDARTSGRRCPRPRWPWP